jgi:glycine dehydrogenase subunit 1
LPYVPHTDDDVRAMLDRIGVRTIDELFDEIPGELRVDSLPGVPEALSEMELMRLAAEN